MTKKQSEMMRRRWNDPEFKTRVSASIKAGMAQPKARERVKASAKTRKPKQEIEDMIVVTHGTTYITAEAFQDRLYHLGEGKPFTYATGDLASACLVEKDARDLRSLVQTLTDQKRIALTQRRRPDLKMKNGLAAFEYIATRRAAVEQAINPRHHNQTAKQPA